MGVMRKDDGLVGVVREGVKMEGVMRKGVEKEVVGDCWGWSVEREGEGRWLN